MIPTRDFVVLADDWKGLPTSTMHLFRSISRQHRVFWLNMTNRMPRLTWSDTKKVVGVARAWGKRSDPANASLESPACGHSHGLHVATPFMIPWFKPAIRRLNRSSFLHTYRRVSRRYQIQNPILFAVFPPAADFVKAVHPALKIYYCYDEFLEYPGFNTGDWQAMETELLENVDALVVTSRDLQQKKRHSRPTLYLPHGVDFEHFNHTAAECRTVVRMEGIRKPIVGFFGLISDWVDLRLIAKLSRAYPDISFVLIGKSELKTDLLADCPNVHQLGLVPYEDLPRYASYFDVALIPFVRSGLTEAVNPLKLLEYYALGLPVLATRLPELESIGGPIRLASTDTEFCDGLGSMLCNDRADRRSEALAIARQNTWDRRVEELSTFIKDLGA